MKIESFHKLKPKLIASEAMAGKIILPIKNDEKKKINPVIKANSFLT
ncbi:MAG: hypothetical protein ACP5SQ_08105 [Candidatus Saccharicenans sp.]